LILAVPLNLLNISGVDPNYWRATDQYGHWNQEAHFAIGNYLAEELYDLIHKVELEY